MNLSGWGFFFFLFLLYLVEDERCFLSLSCLSFLGLLDFCFCNTSPLLHIILQHQIEMFAKRLGTIYYLVWATPIVGNTHGCRVTGILKQRGKCPLPPPLSAGYRCDELVGAAFGNAPDCVTPDRRVNVSKPWEKILHFAQEG